MSRGAIVAGAAGVGAVLVGFFLLAPGTGPDLQAPPVAAAPPANPAAAADAPAADAAKERAPRAPRGTKVRPERLPERLVAAKRVEGAPRPLRTKVTAPALGDRLAHRTQNLDEMQARVDAYAAKQQWDEATLEAVSTALETSHAAVNALVVRVDNGEITWDEARPLMQKARATQAEAVAAVLGPERFADFEKEMAVGSARAAMRAGTRLRPAGGAPEAPTTP